MLELRPDRNLLDPDFTGYKLSLNNIPCHKYSLNDGVDHILPSDDQYSLLHVKVFGLHNHLYADPSSEDDIYYFDENWRLRRLKRNLLTGQFEAFSIVWEMNRKHVRKPGHYNISMSFSSPDFAVVSDGAGSLYIIHTGNRKDCGLFQEVHAEEPCGEEKAFKIVNTRLITEGKHKIIHCLLSHIETKSEKELKENRDKGSFTTLLEWLIFDDGGEGKWHLKAVRQLSGIKDTEYAVIEEDGRAIYVASDNTVFFTKDSEHPIEAKLPVEGHEKPTSPKRYMWLQNQDDITLWLQLAYDAVKQDVSVSVERKCLKISYRGQPVLEGSLLHYVNTDLPAVWTMEKGKLEVTLYKMEPGLLWSNLLLDCNEGEQIIDPALVNEVHERLAHLCSETEVTGGGCVTTFNSEQLEECDEMNSTSSFLFRISPDTHSATHKVNLGGLQWLFTCQVQSETVPAICLRHDVDGCVWLPYMPESLLDTGDQKWPIKHIGTFLAFGYIQAGKTQRKFSVCPPDLSYTAICDATRHIYVYRQPSPVNGTLRNRTTGHHVRRIAVQQLMNLDSQEEILGAYASSEFLYILVHSTLYAFHINP